MKKALYMKFKKSFLEVRTKQQNAVHRFALIFAR